MTIIINTGASRCVYKHNIIYARISDIIRDIEIFMYVYADERFFGSRFIDIVKTHQPRRRCAPFARPSFAYPALAARRFLFDPRRRVPGVRSATTPDHSDDYDDGSHCSRYNLIIVNYIRNGEYFFMSRGGILR